MVFMRNYVYRIVIIGLFMGYVYWKIEFKPSTASIFFNLIYSKTTTSS